jgi:transcriptional regulator with XRE-family HTH domain
MVDTIQESLGEYVRRIRNQNHLSLADVSDQSARFGRRIAPSYINRIENDFTGKVTADRLNALANALAFPRPNC